jgi:hypothetical protein
MIKIIYIILVLIITIWTLYLYISYKKDYENEMRRIRFLETQERERKQKIDYYRSITKPCPILNLTNPRECYIKSNYRCKWDIRGERCNKI